jgi:hypothetical protein
MTRAILYWPTFALDENMEQTSVRVGDGLVAEGFRVGSNAWESNIVTEHFEDEAGFGYGDPTHFMAFPDPPASSSPTASAKGA